MPSLQALGKDFLFFFLKLFAERQPGRHSAKSFYFFWKFSLPSATTPGTRQSLNFFFLNFFAECYSHSTRQSWKICFLVAHFASFAECCDHCARQRRPLPSATLGKVTQNGNFFLHSIMTNTFIQTYITYISHPSHIYLIHHIYISSIAYISHPSHIYLIHPHIHPPITHPSQYVIISAQVHPNKFTSSSKSTSASQVHHQVNNKCKKYNMHSSRPLRLW